MIGIVGLNICFMCKREEETDDHLLLWCPIAVEYWDWLFEMLEWQSVRNQCLLEFLLSWLMEGKYSKWGDLWVVGTSMVAWQLWKERNRRVFKEEMPVELIIGSIKRGWRK